MELEAKQEIEHEQNLRLASETGKKAAQENKQKVLLAVVERCNQIF